MSVPFAGATVYRQDGKLEVRIVQLCRTEPWSSDFKPAQVEASTFGNHQLIIHHHVVEPGTVLYYRNSNTTLPITYFSGLKEPRIGVVSGDNVWTGLTGVMRKLGSVMDVVFHLGNNVRVNPGSMATLYDDLAQLYIATWKRWPMHLMEHRWVPGKSEWHCKKTTSLIGKLAGSGNEEQYVQITAFNDALMSAINGGVRLSNNYYTAKLEVTSPRGVRSGYYAVSNWVPDESGVPQFVGVSELLKDLNTVLPQNDHTTLMLTDECLQLIDHSMAKWVCGQPYNGNGDNYREFAELQQRWNTQLTVICGELRFPVAVQVIYETKDGKQSRYRLCSTGTLSDVSEQWEQDDLVPPKSVSLLPLPATPHFRFGNSFIVMHAGQIRYAYKYQDNFGVYGGMIGRVKALGLRGVLG